MFTVPTPTVDGQIKLEHLEEAVTSFAEKLRKFNGYHIAVVRSTVPPGTTRELVLPLIEQVSRKKAGRDFGLVMQPEYLRQETAEADFARPWFILIGEHDTRAGDIIEKIYRPFNAPIVRTGIEEAEAQKYVHNLFNAVKISFFNEMRMVCEQQGWNANTMFSAVAQSCEGIWNPLYGLKDKGPFDGACLPKDTQGFLDWGMNNGHDLRVLKAVIEQNDNYREYIKERVERIIEPKQSRAYA